MVGHLQPSAEQLESFASSGVSGPVTMLNLLRFRDRADYSATPELAPPDPISGREAYGLYSEAVLPILAALGAVPLVYGTCHPNVIGPPGELWHDLGLIQYPNLDAFEEMVRSPDYLAILGHRMAALADSRLVPTTASVL